MTVGAVPLGMSGMGLTAIVAGGIVIALAAMFVAFRFYTRIITRHGLWWDDWLILVGMVATLVTAALILAGNWIDQASTVPGASNDPDYSAFTSNDDTYMKLAFTSSVFYFTMAGATKLGILLMYTRIFHQSDGFCTQVAAASTLVVAYWIACTVATLLTCRPLSYIWSYDSGYPLYCFNFNLFLMVSGVCEVVLDMLILALPLGVVIRIKLSPRRKLSVMAVFLLGGVVIVTGLVKVILAYNPHGHIPQPGYAEVCSALHAGLSIVCACLPVLKSLVSHATGSTTTSRGSTSRRGQSDVEGWNVIHLDVGNGWADTTFRSKSYNTLTSVERV